MQTHTHFQAGTHFPSYMSLSFVYLCILLSHSLFLSYPSDTMNGVPPEEFISVVLYVYVTLSILTHPYPLLKRNEHVKEQG